MNHHDALSPTAPPPTPHPSYMKTQLRRRTAGGIIPGKIPRADLDISGVWPISPLQRRGEDVRSHQHRRGGGTALPPPPAVHYEVVGNFWSNLLTEMDERKSGDDRVFDGNGGEFNSSEVAGEDLSDGADGVLTEGSENGRSGEEPEFLGLRTEFPEEISDAIDGLDIFRIGVERRCERPFG
nr:hypothetical protein Iba_chr08dCG4480 [Ipomoea batatas]